MADLVCHLGRLCFQKSCRLLELRLCFTIIIKYSLSGDRFDTAYTGCDTGFGYDLECRDGTGRCHMRTTAELYGIAPHVDHAHFRSVLLTKQSHCTGLSRILDAHQLGHYRQVFGDLFIYNALHLCQLLRCHRLEMAEVETGTLRILVRTFLLYVAAQHITQCLL